MSGDSDITASAGETEEEITLTEGDLENAAVIFGAIKSVQRQPKSHGGAGEDTNGNDDDERLAQRFDSHVTTLIGRVGSDLASEANPFKRQNAILGAKLALLDVCFEVRRGPFSPGLCCSLSSFLFAGLLRSFASSLFSWTCNCLSASNNRIGS